jgi:hypothetical protein
MSRAPDPQVRLRWRRLLDSFDPRKFTVADFCRRHQISVASFYKWRREFAKTAPAAKAPSSPRRHQSSPSADAFVPLQIVNASPAQGAPTVQVHLPSGVRIELPADHHPLLWELIAKLQQAEETNG